MQPTSAHTILVKGFKNIKRFVIVGKPKSGMLEQAIAEWSLDKEKCFLIGDKES